MCTLRCQSPSACTKPRALEKPAGRGGSVSTDRDVGGKKTSNISPESCPIFTSALLVTELDSEKNLPRLWRKLVRPPSAWCTRDGWCTSDGAGEWGAALSQEQVAGDALWDACLIAPLRAGPVKQNADVVRALYPERQSETNRTRIGKGLKDAVAAARAQPRCQQRATERSPGVQKETCSVQQ